MLASSHYLQEIRQLLLKRLEGRRAKIFLFGSMATGQSRHTSDIDLGVFPLETLPVGLLSEIREELDESSIPYRVKLIDLSRVPPQFAARIQKEGVLWSD